MHRCLAYKADNGVYPTETVEWEREIAEMVMRGNASLDDCYSVHCLAVVLHMAVVCKLQSSVLFGAVVKATRVQNASTSKPVTLHVRLAGAAAAHCFIRLLKVHPGIELADRWMAHIELSSCKQGIHLGTQSIR